MYRSLFADPMESLFAISVPPPRLDASPGAAGDPSRFAAVYAWPERRVEVTPAGSGLLIKGERDETERLPLDERTFLVDSVDPDNPTMTFGTFDERGGRGCSTPCSRELPRLDE